MAMLSVGASASTASVSLGSETQMRTLVTGGAGFIGSTLVDRLLAEGYEVDVLDDLSSGSLTNLAEARGGAGDRTNRLMFHQIDIRDPQLVDLIARREPEVVFHLAAQADVRVSVARPAFDAEVNVIGTINVLEGARVAGARKLVFASSGGTIYGEPSGDDLPCKETLAQGPLSPYGVSKRVAFDYLNVYRELYGLEFTALALANVYGPRQDPHGEAGVVAIFAGRLLADEACTIYGDGEQTRDYVYVDDVVDAFVRAATKGSGLLLNVGTGVETSVNQLYAAMAGAAGVDRPAASAPLRTGELLRSALDPTRAAIHLGWKPWTDLAEGTARVLEWFKQRNR
jgi:UDP-glucose 4-epimerase